MSVDPEDFLAHYGVKGMKWGKRKRRDPVEKAAGKSARNAARKEIVGNMQKTYNLKSNAGKAKTGAAIVGAFVATPVTNIVVGAQLTKASGYSTGASVVAGIVGGAPGGLAIAELTARANAKKR